MPIDELDETVKNIMNMLTETLNLTKKTTEFHAFTLALNKLREMIQHYGDLCVHAFCEQLKCFDPKEG
jgi:hypothetical protein